ncbi:hypothetical protein [Candidatus Binatus soli]
MGTITVPRIALPGQNTPEPECWYVNMGAVDKDFFTADAMVKAAP